MWKHVLFTRYICAWLLIICSKIPFDLMKRRRSVPYRLFFHSDRQNMIRILPKATILVISPQTDAFSSILSNLNFAGDQTSCNIICHNTQRTTRYLKSPIGLNSNRAYSDGVHSRFTFIPPAKVVVGDLRWVTVAGRIAEGLFEIEGGIPGFVRSVVCKRWDLFSITYTRHNNWFA